MSELQELAKEMLSEGVTGQQEQPLSVQELASEIISFNKERPVAGPDINKLLPIEEEIAVPDEFGGLSPEFQDRSPVKDKLKAIAKTIVGVSEDTTVSLFSKEEEDLEFGEENMGVLPKDLTEAFEAIKPTMTMLSSPLTISTNALLAITGNDPKKRLRSMANIITLSPEEGDELFVGDLLHEYGITDEKIDGILAPIIGPGFAETAQLTDKIGLIGDLVGFSKFDKIIKGLFSTGNVQQFSTELTARIRDAKKAGKIANPGIVTRAIKGVRREEGFARFSGKEVNTFNSLGKPEVPIGCTKAEFSRSESCHIFHKDKQGKCANQHCNFNVYKKTDTFNSLGKQVDDLEKKIDLLDESSSEFKKIESQIVELETIAAQKAFDGAKKILQKVIGSEGGTGLGSSFKTILRNYGLVDKPPGSYFFRQIESKIDSSDFIEGITKSIANILFSRKYPNADFLTTMESRFSGITQKGKESILLEAEKMANQINRELKGFLLDNNSKVYKKTAMGVAVGLTTSLALLEGQDAEAGVFDKIIQFPKRAAKKTIDAIDPLTKFPQKAINKRANGFRIHELVKDRIFNINEAFLESEKFIIDFNLNLTKKEREALPFIRQGLTHDAQTTPVRLKWILKKIKKEELFDIIKNPSNELLKYNEKLGKYFDDAHEMLREAFDDVAFVKDYVTHLWDIPKGRKSEVVNYFVTHNPFTKKRKIPTLDAGIKLGLKPKHLDIVKILQVYDQYKIKAVFNNRFAESLNAMTDAATGMPVVLRKDVAPVDWVLVDHPALNRAMAVGQTTIKVPITHFVSTVRETIEKIITIEKTTAGGVVKDSASKPVRALERTITDALLSRGMTAGESSAYLKKLKAVYAGADVGKGVIGETSKEEVKRKTRRIVQEIDDKYPANVPVLQKQAVKVHPEIANEVKAVFSSGFSNKAVNAFEIVNAFAKKSMLSFSFFHHFALTESAFSSGIGAKAMKMWNPYKVYKALKNKDFAIYQNMPAARDSIQHGVVYGPLSDFMVTRVRKGIEAVENATKNIPVVGRTAKLARQANDLWDSALWDYYHNTLKLYAYENHVQAALKRASKKAKRELTSVEIREIKEGIGTFVNDSFGGQNWELMPFFRHAKNRQAVHWGLLSPDWTVSVLKQAFSPIKGHRQAVAAGSIERRLAGTALSKRAHLFWIRAIVYYNIIAQAANFYNSRKYEWKNGKPVASFNGDARFTDENAPGHKLNIFAGFNDDGTEKYIRMGKQFREVMEWLYEPELKLGAKLAPVTRQVIAQFSKHDPGSGFPTSYADLPFWKSLLPRLKELVTSALPFSFRGLIEDSSLAPFLYALPTSRGMTRSKTIREFKTAILSGDQEREIEVGIAALRNNLNADELYTIAVSSLKGDATKEAKEVAKWVYSTIHKYPEEARPIVYQKFINQGIITPKVKQRLLKMSQDRVKVRTQRKVVGLE